MVQRDQSIKRNSYTRICVASIIFPIFRLAFITWKEKLKSEEAEIARKGVAGISGIGRTLEKFQNSTSAFANVTVDHALGTSREANALSSKFRRIVEADHHLNENEARKGKKRPNEDHDHPKTKLKHMVRFSYIYKRW